MRPEYEDELHLALVEGVLSREQSNPLRAEVVRLGRSPLELLLGARPALARDGLLAARRDPAPGPAAQPAAGASHPKPGAAHGVLLHRACLPAARTGTATSPCASSARAAWARCSSRMTRGCAATWPSSSCATAAPSSPSASSPRPAPRPASSHERVCEMYEVGEVQRPRPTSPCSTWRGSSLGAARRRAHPGAEDPGDARRRRGRARRPPRRADPPRPEALQHPGGAHRGRRPQALRHGLRPGARLAGRAHRHRRGAGHAPLHGARAGPRRGGPAGSARGRLQPGRHALPGAHRPAALRSASTPWRWSAASRPRSRAHRARWSRSCRWTWRPSSSSASRRTARPATTRRAPWPRTWSGSSRASPCSRVPAGPLYRLRKKARKHRAAGGAGLRRAGAGALAAGAGRPGPPRGGASASASPAASPRGWSASRPWRATPPWRRCTTRARTARPSARRWRSWRPRCAQGGARPRGRATTPWAGRSSRWETSRARAHGSRSPGSAATARRAWPMPWRWRSGQLYQEQLCWRWSACATPSSVRPAAASSSGATATRRSAYLKQSRGRRRSCSAEYVTALIAFYEGRYDDALAHLEKHGHHATPGSTRRPCCAATSCVARATPAAGPGRPRRSAGGPGGGPHGPGRRRRHRRERVRRLLRHGAPGATPR